MKKSKKLLRTLRSWRSDLSAAGSENVVRCAKVSTQTGRKTIRVPETVCQVLTFL